jgi:hypothetical protein
MSQQHGSQYDLPPVYDYAHVSATGWNVGQTYEQPFAQAQYCDANAPATYAAPPSATYNYGDSNMTDSFDHNTIDPSFGTSIPTTTAATHYSSPARQDTPMGFDVYRSPQDGTNDPNFSSDSNVTTDTRNGWTGRFQNARDAAAFLAGLEEPLHLPNVPGDNVIWVAFMSMEDVAKEAFKAITHPFGPPPTEWDAIKVCYYQKQQVAATEKITEFLSTPQGHTTAEARLFMALQEAINVHLVGVPASHLVKRKRGDRTAYRTDLTLICSARLEAMRSGIEQNKLIAWDVLTGQGLTDFARNPAEFLGRKLVNVKSNGNKKEGEKVFKRKRDQEALRGGAEAHSSDNTSEGQDQMALQADDQTTSTSSTSTRKNGKKLKVSDSGMETSASPRPRPKKQQRQEPGQLDTTTAPFVNSMYESLSIDDHGVQVGQPYYLDPKLHSSGPRPTGSSSYQAPPSSEEQ